MSSVAGGNVRLLKHMYLVRYVSFTAALTKPMPSVTSQDEIAFGSFLGHVSVSFLSGSLLRFLSVLRLVSDAVFIYQPHLSIR